MSACTSPYPYNRRGLTVRCRFPPKSPFGSTRGRLRWGRRVLPSLSQSPSWRFVKRSEEVIDTLTPPLRLSGLPSQGRPGSLGRRSKVRDSLPGYRDTLTRMSRCRPPPSVTSSSLLPSNEPLNTRSGGIVLQHPSVSAGLSTNKEMRRRASWLLLRILLKGFSV